MHAGSRSEISCEREQPGTGLTRFLRGEVKFDINSLHAGSTKIDIPNGE